MEDGTAQQQEEALMQFLALPASIPLPADIRSEVEQVLSAASLDRPSTSAAD